MSNFSFLLADFPTLHADAVEAEHLTFVSPKAAAIFCRSTLENAINWLYDNDPKLTRPFKAELSALMYEHCFASQFNQTMLGELHLIRKTGNVAAHGNKVSPQDALASLKYLYRFLRQLVIYYGKQAPAPHVFDESLIATGKANLETPEQLDALKQQLAAKEQAARDAEQANLKQADENAQLKAQIAQQQAELAARKQGREQSINMQEAVPLLVSEAETRRRYIDLSLKECGWDDLKDGIDLEYEVKGMPASTNPTGKGFVDYVLWGDDGLPLAVVEAKKTMTDARKGKHQAELYANCLEQMTGQRPVIFYSNGFETHLWDDQCYPEREVQGFYSKEELQLMIARRSSRIDLRTFKVNTEIAGRAYQLEALKRVAENFVSSNKQGELKGRARQSLLVMATGSGKTRTAAAMVDMLTKSNWVKRVLFLADRNALVTQAKNAFNEYLPHLSAIDLTKEKEDNGTRLVFSTYPTIMNRIDNVLDGERFYGVGHFDLIIVDEAHRSVYQKYKAIFSYFDALLVGLTATPKTDIDHNTYGLFGIEDDNPTFAYELDSAVRDGFLVPPKAISVPLKFIREGVHYHQLSEREKLEYEEKFGDPTNDDVPDEIDSAALNSWLFNTDTVDKALAHLMAEGIKVQGGEKLGKTIIFAKSHKHALFIEERFNKNYPEYAGKFLRVIDNYESKAQSLLETFADKYVENEPQIAVSVDMMDTGVDAPRVLNLVFFKQVKSATKFWQMIGRGTRLCPDIFGIGHNKHEFVIFDFCQNFEFFDAKPDGFNTKAIKSLTQQIFEARLEVALTVRNIAESTDDERALAEEYIAELYQGIAALDRTRFMVKAKLRYVVEYTEPARWQNISKSDMLDINMHLSPLALPSKDDDELAKRFDILILNFQLALLTNAYSSERFITKISSTAAALLKKQNIPAVAKQLHVLNELLVQQFWKTVNIHRLENVRLALRDLMKYLDKDSQITIETNFEDEIDPKGVEQHDLIPAYGRLQSYKDRVESYVRENSHHLVIRKIKTNKPITETEINALESILFDGSTVGTKQDYMDNYGDQPLGVFIRHIVGLDVSAAQEAFAEFIQAGNLKADQMTFISNIITYLSQNGMIDKSMLFEPPFTHIHDQGLLGVFDQASATKVVQLIDSVNNNAYVSHNRSANG